MTPPRYLRTTHTFALLEVTEQTFVEIRDKLVAAGYQHCLIDSPDTGPIDLQGIALVLEPSTSGGKDG